MKTFITIYLQEQQHEFSRISNSLKNLHEEHEELNRHSSVIERAFSGSDGMWDIKDVEDLYEALSFVEKFMNE